MNLDQVAADPLVRAVLAKFPGAQISSIRSLAPGAADRALLDQLLAAPPAPPAEAARVARQIGLLQLALGDR